MIKITVKKLNVLNDDVIDKITVSFKKDTDSIKFLRSLETDKMQDSIENMHLCECISGDVKKYTPSMILVNNKASYGYNLYDIGRPSWAQSYKTTRPKPMYDTLKKHIPYKLDVSIETI